MDLLYEQTFRDISCLWRRENAHFFSFSFFFFFSPPFLSGRRGRKGEKVRVIATRRSSLSFFFARFNQFRRRDRDVDLGLDYEIFGTIVLQLFERVAKIIDLLSPFSRFFIFLSLLLRLDSSRIIRIAIAYQFLVYSIPDIG